MNFNLIIWGRNKHHPLLPFYNIFNVSFRRGWLLKYYRSQRHKQFKLLLYPEILQSCWKNWGCSQTWWSGCNSNHAFYFRNLSILEAPRRHFDSMAELSTNNPSKFEPIRVCLHKRRKIRIGKEIHIPAIRPSSENIHST